MVEQYSPSNALKRRRTLPNKDNKINKTPKGGIICKCKPELCKPLVEPRRVQQRSNFGLRFRHINFKRCREEIASALNDFGNRCCKRESLECYALKEWKISIFNI